MKTLEQIYEKFIVNLMNDNNNAFFVYVLSQQKVKKFVIDKFACFYNKTLESDSVWFFRNCFYLYLFVNGKANFQRIELKEIFDCFFKKDDDEVENFFGMDRLEKL